MYEVLRPNHVQITNALRNGKRITEEIIAKATEHLRVRVIPFWKAKNTLYHLLEGRRKLLNPRGHNKRLYVLKPYTGSEKHAKKKSVVVRSSST